MSAVLTVVYDDREAPPVDIESIIGAARFSEILHRRITLGEAMRREIKSGGADDLFHLSSPHDAIHLAELIENSPARRVFLLLPSAFVPGVAGALAHLVEKARYALRSTFVSSASAEEAPALLLGDDMVSVLRAPNRATARETLRRIALGTPTMVDHCNFRDLRDTETFLDFISGATETRHFNAMKIDKRVFHKSSSDREKMAREHGFFHLASERMKPFLIASFDFFDDGSRAGYSMERLAAPDAALQIIHRAFDRVSFEALTDSFFAFIDARSTNPVGRDAVRDLARTAILGKMHARLDAFLTTQAGQTLDALLQHAGPTGNLRAMQHRATRLIESAIDRDMSSALAFGHGDPCFSNILFDRRTRLFRLIDPRGARTMDEAWAHPLYDLAKFSHSILGGYDFVNNDLFDCALDIGLNLNLRLHDDGPPELFRTVFVERLRSAGYQLDVVRAYELSLFMSMLPLHVDHPRKLAGFAMLAARLIQELEQAQ